MRLYKSAPQLLQFSVLASISNPIPQFLQHLLFFQNVIYSVFPFKILCMLDLSPACSWPIITIMGLSDFLYLNIFSPFFFLFHCNTTFLKSRSPLLFSHLLIFCNYMKFRFVLSFFLHLLNRMKLT